MIIIILILFLLLLIAFKYAKTIENFTQDQVIVYSTFYLNHSNWINKTGQKQWKYKNIEYNSYDVFVKALNTIGKKSPTLFIVDPIDYQKRLMNYKVIMNTPTGFFVSITTLQYGYCEKCPFDLENKKIGFFDRSDYYFIKSLMFAYQIDPSKVNLFKLDINQINVLGKILKEGILDRVITFVIPNSEFSIRLQFQRVAVKGFKQLDYERIKLVYPYVNPLRIELKKELNFIAKSKIYIMDVENDTYVPSMNMKVLLVSGNVVSKSKETFISRLDIDPETLNPLYLCYGDMNIETKALCESDYDVIGLPKSKKTIWDRPCRNNEECPFYKANKTYPNNKGGCLKTGRCEFPIGIERIGFKKYKGKAFCYGCKNPMNSLCCDQQKSPDYAFPNDYEQRRKAGVPTSIPIL